MNPSLLCFLAFLCFPIACSLQNGDLNVSGEWRLIETNQTTSQKTVSNKFGEQGPTFLFKENGTCVNLISKEEFVYSIDNEFFNWGNEIFIIDSISNNYFKFFEKVEPGFVFKTYVFERIK